MKKAFITVSGIILFILFLFVFVVLLSYRGDIAPEILENKYADETSAYLNVEGVNIHIRVKGKGEPIFLIHGSFSSLHTWEAWENDLNPYFMTISMDLPGHGLTGPDPEKRYSQVDYANFIFGIADQLNLKEFHVAGNSMGGGVALQMASAYPERILSLNLIDASGAPPVHGSDTTKHTSSKAGIFKIAENPIFNKLLLKCTPKFLFKMNMDQVFFDDAKVSDKMVTRYYELLRREGNRQATLDRLTSRKHTTVDFSRITMPVLIMWGNEDEWISIDQGKRLAAALPNATLKIFENAGHVPMEEIPTKTVEEYLAFLGIQVDVDYFSAPKYFSHVP